MGLDMKESLKFDKDTSPIGILDDNQPYERDERVLAFWRYACSITSTGHPIKILIMEESDEDTKDISDRDY